MGNIYPSCAEISVVIIDVRDAQYSGGAGIENGEATELSLDQYTPKLQLAEMSFYKDESVLNHEGVSSTTIVEETGVSTATRRSSSTALRTSL